MNIYIVVTKTSRCTYPIKALWKLEDAQQLVGELEKKEPQYYHMFWRLLTPTLSDLVRDYYKFRDYKDPDLNEAFNWLVSEAGELAGAINQTQVEGWVRNNDHSQDSVADELGDVLMMLIKTAEKAGVNVLDAMVEKWKRKGWKP